MVALVHVRTALDSAEAALRTVLPADVARKIIRTIL